MVTWEGSSRNGLKSCNMWAVILVCFAQSWAVLWTWQYDFAVQTKRGELLTFWANLSYF